MLTIIDRSDLIFNARALPIGEIKLEHVANTSLFAEQSRLMVLIDKYACKVLKDNSGTTGLISREALYALIDNYIESHKP